MKSGTVCAKCWRLALTDFGRDPRSSDRLRGAENLFFFVCVCVCTANNARFRRFSVRKKFTTFQHNNVVGEAVNTFGTEF